MFCDSNRDGTWGSIWGIIRIGCRGCTRGGTFGDTVSGTWGSTSSKGGIRGCTSWDATDCFLSGMIGAAHISAGRGKDKILRGGAGQKSA